MRRVLSLCDLSGNMVAPWAKAGWECHIVDIQHPAGRTMDGRIVRHGCDVMDYEPDGPFDAAFAFPPCTDLAVSGARWFQGKGLMRLSDAIRVFARCVEIIEQTGAPGFCENPVSVIASHFRRPDHIFDPCDYGDTYVKRTCLWTFNGFEMPPKRPVLPLEGSKMHLMGPSPDRANRRSETPTGFAQAVFEHMSARLLEAAK